MPIWLTLVLVFLASLGMPPTQAARSALLPMVVGRDKLPTAIIINQTTGQAAQVVGYLAGAATAVAISPRVALAIDAVTFLMSAAFLAYGVRPRPPAQSRAQRSHLLSESAEGFRLVFGSTALRAIAVMIFILTAFSIVPEGLAAAWAASGSSDDVTRGFDQGLIMAASPIGYVIGGLLIGRLVGPARRDRLVRPLALLSIVPLIPSILTPPAPAVAVLVMLAGMAQGGLTPTLNGKFVLILPHGYRARAYGVMQTGLQLSQFAGVMITGLLADRFYLPLVVGVWSIGGTALMGWLATRWPSERIFEQALAEHPPAAAEPTAAEPAVEAPVSPVPAVVGGPRHAAPETAVRPATNGHGPRVAHAPRHAAPSRRPDALLPGAGGRRRQGADGHQLRAGLTEAAARRTGWQDGGVTAPAPDEASFFDAIGGEPTFRRLVDRFYQGVAEDPLLRPMYPEEDLGPAADRLTLFLMQYWGGPNTYSTSRGHPRLRMRHAPFRVGPERAGCLAAPHARGGRLAGAARAVPQDTLGLSGARRLLHGEQHGVGAMPQSCPGRGWLVVPMTLPDDLPPAPLGAAPMRRRLLAAAVIISAAVACAHPAAADPAQAGLVSANPVDFTPHVLDGTVWSMAVVGDTVVVGGAFTKVTDSGRRQTYARRNIFAFGLRDGAIRSFAPSVDGAVYSLAAGADGTIYAGGAFKKVNGTSQRGLTRLTVSGQRVSAFGAKINWGDVRSVAVRGSQLYAAGTFSAINGVNRSALARLSATTGAVDTGFDAKLSAPGLTRTRVEHFDISPDGRKLVAIGALLRSGGYDRTQIAMFDLSGPGAALTSWYTDAYKPACMKGFDTYLRQVKFSPDGAYFVVAATGRDSAPNKLCDSAARFESTGAGRHNPTWVQRTGGDSLYAVAVTGSAVYLGGHQRYFDNPFGSDAKGPGPGAVSRQGIGAVSVLTGRALTWNPTRARGVGVRCFLVVPHGLLVGSDTDQLGHEYHGRVGMFPL